jgi:hypothetical protein
VIRVHAAAYFLPTEGFDLWERFQVRRACFALVGFGAAIPAYVEISHQTSSYRQVRQWR